MANRSLDLAQIRGDQAKEAGDFVQTQGRRNLIINGGMTVAQRGTSATDISSTGYYTADRIRTSFTGSSSAIIKQEVLNDQDVGDFIGNAIKNTIETTAAEGSSGFNYRVETDDVRSFVGKQMTLSFYIKTDNPVILDLNIGDGVNPGTTIDSISVDANWKRHIVSFTIIDIDAASEYLDIVLRLPNDTINAQYITGLQLELGDTATPFEQRSYGEELALCQRYYEKGKSGFYTFLDTVNRAAPHFHQFSVSKRVIPTVTLSNIGAVSNSSSVSISASTTAMRYQPNQNTDGGSRTTFDWEADAEL